MTLRKRLDRLTAKRAPAGRAVTCVLWSDPLTGEPLGAYFPGGPSLMRDPGETVDAFMARAMAGQNVTIFLPDNGR